MALPDPDDRAAAADLLVVRLGLPVALAEELLRAVETEQPLGAEVAAPFVQELIDGGLLARAAGGALLPGPWCVDFCRGGRDLSPEIHVLTVPVPAVAGPQAEHLGALLADRSMLVEVVAPRTSLAPS